MVEGLKYLHESLNIVHRDIKPENIVYCTVKGEGLLAPGEIDDPAKDRVKIGDFTVALEVQSENMRIRSREGTEAYLAPECFSTHSYLPKPIDIWALGLVLYAYLFGSLPFFSTTKEKKSYDLHIPKEASNDLRSLLVGLLTTNPTARLTVSQAAAHPWFNPI